MRSTARKPLDCVAAPVARPVYLEPAWKSHTSYRLLLQRPPNGYRFVGPVGGRESLIKTASRFRAAYSLLYALDRLVPAHLLKSLWDVTRRPPKGTMLTYAVNHLVLRGERWLLDLPGEHVSNTIGGYRHFRRYRGLVRRALLSPRCGAIIVNGDYGRRALAAALGEKVAAKAAVVPWAVEAAKPFVKEYAASGPVKLLFVDSANIPGQFYYKGGLEAMEAFAALRERYPDLELLVRSVLPEPVRKRFAGMPGLRLIEGVVPWPEMEREFMTADIFLFPTHFTPVTVILDAMSYGLPVVTTDVWGNPEVVEEGVSGLLVHDGPVAKHRAQMLPRYFIPPPGSRLDRRLFGTADRRLVDDLVRALIPLIEDQELRQRMGMAGRHAVEAGPLSIGHRNKVLQGVLDGAVDD